MRKFRGAVSYLFLSDYLFLSLPFVLVVGDGFLLLLLCDLSSTFSVRPLTHRFNAEFEGAPMQGVLEKDELMAGQNWHFPQEKNLVTILGDDGDG